MSAEISNVVQRYSMYASRRKFELVEPHVYSVINYREADAVLEQWANLVADAQAIYDKLPAALQATFFQTSSASIDGGRAVDPYSGWRSAE